MALTTEQLNNSAILEKIRAKAQEFIKYEQMSDAWNLINEIEVPSQRLADSSPEIYKQYQKIIAQLKFIAIPFLIDEQIMELIQKQFLGVFKEGAVNVEKRLRVSLASKSVFARDQFRKDVLAFLKKNQQRIGDKTIGQWLLNYDEIAGARKNTSLERSKFISQSPEANNLPEESKQCLLRLLEFYDNLKVTIPLTFIGISEITLKEFLRDFGIPLPGEERRTPLPKIEKPQPMPQPMPQPVAEKPEPKPAPAPVMPPPLPKTEESQLEAGSPWAGKISPYEEKREIKATPPTEKELPTEAPTDVEAKVGAEALDEYQIRTMKQDIKMAKKQPIPPKPQPKIKDNIVDLSGK
ncbi:MAG: hypothetical protein KAS87_06545 [Candidatus Omnitrophica bacterium]|nr:hypothetical protein [Candidatus Omnitrophota bacterium]